MVWGEKPEVTDLKEKVADKIEEQGVEAEAKRKMAIESRKGGFQRLVEGIPVVGDIAQMSERDRTRKQLELIARAKRGVR